MWTPQPQPRPTTKHRNTPNQQENQTQTHTCKYQHKTTKEKHRHQNKITKPTKDQPKNMHALPGHQWGWWPDWFGPGFAPFRITLQWSTDSASFRQKNFHLIHILGSKTLALAVCVGGRPLTCSGGVAAVACCGTLRQLNIHETSPKIRNN